MPDAAPALPPPTTPSFRDFLRWRRERRRRLAEHQRAGERLPRVSPGVGERLNDPADSITWCGHSSVLHRLDERTVLSDPIWSERCAHLIRRLTPAAPSWDRLPVPDLVTISHNHYDHLDAPTVKRLRHQSTFCVPRGVARWFRRRGFPRVEEFDWWDTRDVAGLRVTFVPAQHFSGRTLWDRNESRWGGWVLQGTHHRIYHAGCTGYFPGFREIAQRFPRLDVACLPIGAYDPRWFMAPVHLDPEEAGQAYLETGARFLLPIHWGTFRLTDEPMDEPPLRLQAFLENAGIETKRLLLGDLGQTHTLDALTKET